MTFDVRALAREKHLETGHGETEWENALENARMSLKVGAVGYRDLAHVARASRSPEKFTSMARLIYQYTKAHPNGGRVADALFRCVNSSPFSLSDWVDAIDYFYRWLVEGKRKVDLLPMLKYLECCVAAPDAKKNGQTLRALVEDMLDIFGYEAG